MIIDDTALAPTANTTGIRRSPRVGIVGTGFIGVVHARAARAAGGVIVGAAASSTDRADAARDAIGADAGFADVDTLLDSGIEALHICTPNATHHDLAVAAIRAGVAVICEKPLTTTVQDAEHLTRELAAGQLIGTVPFVYRFHPMIREIRARIAKGETGRVALVSGSYLQDWLADADQTNWRVDPELGGPSRTFADIGSHWFDLLEFTLGESVARVSALFSTQFGSRQGQTQQRVSTEDTVTVQFVTDSGVLGSFAASQVARGRKNRLALEISGDRHSLFFDQESPESVWQGSDSGARILVRDPHTLTPDAARLCVVPAGHPQGYQDCFNAFVADTYAALDGEHHDGLPEFADGLRSVRVVDAVTRSAHADGQWVDCPRGSEPS